MDREQPQNVHKTAVFYGRRKARPLRNTRQTAIDTLLPILKFVPTSTIDVHQKRWLDIGFGNGEVLAAWVTEQPDTQFIGVEPFINGVSAFLTALPNPTPHNIKIWPDMAETLWKHLPDNCADIITLQNPDPWPKARHHKRRFVRPDNITQLARILKPNGLFFTCTDHPDLATHTNDMMQTSQHFKNISDTNPPAFWRPTRYAIKDKAKSGQMFFMRYIKSGDVA